MYTFSIDGALRPQSRPAESADAARNAARAAPALKEINAVEDSSIGASAAGNPEVRHDGVVLSYVGRQTRQD